ncbi:MAG: protein-L-isoaspartate(D-aspartate) O-methyltransferase [Rhodospirillaceae bacterium]
MNLEADKVRLIKSLRGNGITDVVVLAALEKVPRERYVPRALIAEAYEDIPLPIGYGQTISQPLVVAYMTGLLELKPHHRVLEIGTGSGYQAAILAQLVRSVYTVERLRPLLAEAERRFSMAGLTNINTRHGDGIAGWPEEAPFDRILTTAGAFGTDPPEALTAQLAAGGILVIPLGIDRREQRIVRVRRTETGFQREELWPVRFVPLLPGVPEEQGPSRPR